MHESIGLLATARTKAIEAAPVKDFYKSPLFIKTVAYAEKVYNRYYFYNAKDGLLFPDQVMAPYNVSIKTFTEKEKREWAGHVVSALRRLESPEFIKVYLHGGQVYRRWLEPALTDYGFHYEVPLKGMSIGKQLQWYKGILEE